MAICRSIVEFIGRGMCRGGAEAIMASERIVYLVDDDPAIHRALEPLLKTAGYSVTTYATSLSFLDAAPGLLFGCVLLDVQAPDMVWLTLLAKLANLENHLPVVVMAGKGDVQTAVRAVKGGAVDFLKKPIDDEVLISAIESALLMHGGPNRAIEVAEAAHRISTLRPRERQVLDSLVSGRPNKVIAYNLGISVRTVELHRARMMKRLGVRQFSEAIRLAVMAQLSPPIGPAATPPD